MRLPMKHDGVNYPTSRILAIGGGGFMMEGDISRIDRYIVTLTGKARPKICVLPTPTGDAESVIAGFYAAFNPIADVSQLTPFRKASDRSIPLSDMASALLSQDAIFVTGGNT